MSCPLDHLIEQKRPFVERVIADLSRRHFLSAPETDEFRRVVDRAFERNDCELLRAVDGKPGWETYLETVVANEFFTFQAALWGDWRPSDEATRLGPAAMLLEELVARDGLAVPEAIEWMRTTHRVDMPRHRLMKLAGDLGLLQSAPSIASGADARLHAALSDAVALLSPDDRLILQLRFRDRQPVTRIARLLRMEARPVQRRLETIKEVLRRSLDTQGISTEDVETLLRYADSDVAHPSQKCWGLVSCGPK